MRHVKRGLGVAIALLAAMSAAGAHAQDVKRLDIRPSPGGTRTIFSFTYRDLGPLSGPEDEILYVVGPRDTACEGIVIEESIAGEGTRERYRLGPGADYAPFTAGDDEPISRWCRGRYKVVIKYVNDDGADATAVARGRFRVGH